MKKIIKTFKEFKEKKMNAEAAKMESVLEYFNSIAKQNAEFLVQLHRAEVLCEEIKDSLLTRKIEHMVDEKVENLHDTFMAELAKHNIEKHGEEVLDYDKLFDKEEE